MTFTTGFELPKKYICHRDHHSQTRSFIGQSCVNPPLLLIRVSDEIFKRSHPFLMSFWTGHFIHDKNPSAQNMKSSRNLIPLSSVEGWIKGFLLFILWGWDRRTLLCMASFTVLQNHCFLLCNALELCFTAPSYNASLWVSEPNKNKCTPYVAWNERLPSGNTEWL